MEEEVVWVKLKTGERWEMIRVFQDSTGVHGLAKRLRVDGQRPPKTHLREDIDLLEERVVSSGKTTILVGAVAGLFFAIFSGSQDFDPLGGGD
jgi:hypothetical protein